MPSSDPVVQPGKTRRRTQAERSAETQGKIMAATIACLHRMGYGATSLAMVADEASVTRGAMVYHYPTKVALMLDLVRAVFDEERQRYRESFERIKDPRERLLAVPTILWEVLSRPSGVAVMEVMTGARSDTALTAPLKTLQDQIRDEAHAAARELYAASGLESDINYGALNRLLVAAVRGLVIEYMRTGELAPIRESLAVLRNLLAAQLEVRTSAPRVR